MRFKGYCNDWHAGTQSRSQIARSSKQCRMPQVCAIEMAQRHNALATFGRKNGQWIENCHNEHILAKSCDRMM
jgi:hypothetical protein